MAAGLLEAVEHWLRERGHEVRRFGALEPEGDDAWPSVGRSVGVAVAAGDADCGVVCCWTGTGVSIAANKVEGVRAALCGDATTAGGAREWNDANVLCLSIRSTTPALAEEILAAWFAGTPTHDPVYAKMIDSIRST
jgi:ribose 5-phosphate isomerase B